jgi:hypothetical protein
MDGWERYAYAGKVRLIRDQRHACFKAAQAPRAISAGVTNGQTRRPIQSYVVVVLLLQTVSGVPASRGACRVLVYPIKLDRHGLRL